MHTYIGEGNGNPLQCSCLENPRGRGAWWAAVHGVAQSRTRLKPLISSNRATKPTYVSIISIYHTLPFSHAFYVLKAVLVMKTMGILKIRMSRSVFPELTVYGQLLRLQ